VQAEHLKESGPIVRIVAVMLLVISAGWCQLLSAGGLIPYEGIDEPLELALPDLAGNQQTLSEQRGKVVLVNFWATWCSPCLIEMPDMQRLMAAMVNRPFTILAVNVKESGAKVWRFKNLLGVNFTTLLDSTGAVARDWDVQVYPTSFLVDPEGIIRYAAYGLVDWDAGEIKRVIEQMLPDREIKSEVKVSVMPR